MGKRFKGEAYGMDERPDIVLKALGIPEILESIFKNLDVERLKRCRRVCLKWCNEVSRLFRTRVIPLYCHSEWPEFQRLVETGQRLIRLLCPFQEMYGLVYAANAYSEPFDWLNPPFPITRLTLSFGVNSTGDPKLTRHVLLLLQSCSKTLTHLQTHPWNLTEELEKGLPGAQLSFHFPKLKALRAEYFIPSPEHSSSELKFFLLVISSAPELVQLELIHVSCASELLRQVCLKGIEKLKIECSEGSEFWSALSSIDSENLKSVSTNGPGAYSFLPVNNNFYSRFSSTLEHVSKSNGPWRIWGCPNLKRLDFRLKEPVDLSSFPLLTKVRVLSSWNSRFLTLDQNNILQINPSRTVREVQIHKCYTPFVSRRKAVLGQFLNCFPCATSWRVNYQTLPTFCQVLADNQFQIQKLRVLLSCFRECPCHEPRPSVRETADINSEPDTFSTLHLLTNLRELELQRNLDRHFAIGIPRPEHESNKINKQDPFNLARVPFSKLPQLRTLRLFARTLDLPPDLTAIKHLDIAIEVIVGDVRHDGPINWSDSILSMENVTIFTEPTKFPD